MCGEKQSLQRIYARSHSAKDCRLVSTLLCAWCQPVTATCCACMQSQVLTSHGCALLTPLQVTQQYNSARGQIEDKDAHRALQQAYAEAECGDYESGGEDEQQQRQEHLGQLADAARPGRWLEYAQEGEVGAGCLSFYWGAGAQLGAGAYLKLCKPACSLASSPCHVMPACIAGPLLLPLAASACSDDITPFALRPLCRMTMSDARWRCQSAL